MNPNNSTQGGNSNTGISTEPVTNTSLEQPTQMPNEAANPLSSPLDNGSGKRSRKKNSLIILGVFILFMLALSVIIFVLIQWEKSKSGDTQTQSPKQVTVRPSTPPDSGNQIDTNTDITFVECTDFPQMLESCTKYSCDFIHPATGDRMTRTILGFVDNGCSYEEEIPNSGVMKCNYDDELRTATAQYYRNITEAESYGTSTAVELDPDGSEVDTTSTIDGDIVDNPLEEAITTGQCVISGY